MNKKSMEEVRFHLAKIGCDIKNVETHYSAGGSTTHDIELTCYSAESLMKVFDKLASGEISPTKIEVVHTTEKDVGKCEDCKQFEMNGDFAFCKAWHNFTKPDWNCSRFK